MSPLTRAIRIAVANLAGVPSIVFGLFGLGFFVQFVGAGIDKALLPRREGLRPAGADLGGADHGGADAAGGHRRHRGGAARRAARAARGVAGARRDEVPDRLQRRRAAGERRHPDRHDPGGEPRRRRGGARSCSPARPTSCRSCPSSLSSQFMSPSYHVYVLSTQSPDVDATKPILYATVLVLLALTFTLNIAAVVVRARMRRRRGSRRMTTDADSRHRAPKLTVRDLTVFYGAKKAVGPGRPRHRRPARHRADRPVGLRQVDVPALAQPHERAHPRRAHRRATVTLDGRTDLRPAASTRSRCGAASAWCSSARTRSRSRSSRTSPTACASAACATRAELDEPRRARLRAGGAVGRGQGSPATTARWRCRAASSSGCASRARWPSSPRCC